MVGFIQDKSKVGRIILSKLQKKRKTMKQLSQEAGISYSTITKLVDGTVTNPSFMAVVKISKYLNIPLEDLAASILEGNGKSR